MSSEDSTLWVREQISSQEVTEGVEEMHISEKANEGHVP